jgi:hypothetical protein
MHIGLHFKYLLYLSDFKEPLTSTDLKKPQIQDFIKIRPDAAELFHSDGQTNRQAQIILAFRNFANAPKVVSKYLICGQHTVFQKV